MKRDGKLRFGRDRLMRLLSWMIRWVHMCEVAMFWLEIYCRNRLEMVNLLRRMVISYLQLAGASGLNLLWRGCRQKIKGFKAVSILFYLYRARPRPPGKSQYKYIEFTNIFQAFQRKSIWSCSFASSCSSCPSFTWFLLKPFITFNNQKSKNK